MELTLHQLLSKYLFETDDETVIIENINTLVESQGEVVLRALFKILANIAIPLDQCQTHWHNCLEHQLKLSQLLNRKITLTTALCDYLKTTTDYLPHPRLIDASAYETMIHNSIHDQLTGLYNRRYFDETYHQQAALAVRFQQDLAILFLDLDNFKYINDTHGHLAGDIVLEKVAEAISKEKRDSDIAARFGGEEFVLILTHTDNLSAFAFAERLRETIASLEIDYLGNILRVTISGGIASYPLSSNSPEKLLEMADSAVYLAKGAGRNKICQYREEKRRYLRVKLSQPILAKELDFDNSQTYSGMSKNICVGGILFENPEKLDLGTLIQLKVSMQNSDPVIIIGKVVRVEQFDDNKFDIGVITSFKELDKIAASEVAEYLKKEPLFNDQKKQQMQQQQ